MTTRSASSSASVGSKPAGLEQAGHALGVVDVHLAAVGLDQVLARHYLPHFRFRPRATFAFRFRLGAAFAFAWARSSRAPASTCGVAGPPLPSSAQSPARAPSSSRRVTVVTVRGPRTALGDGEVGGGLRGDRRQVGDAQHLGGRSPSRRSFSPTTVAVRPPMPASTSSKTSVRRGWLAGAERLERQHHPRQLAARGDAGQRPRRLADVGGQEELAAVDAAGVPRRARRRRWRAAARSACRPSPDRPARARSRRRSGAAPPCRAADSRRGARRGSARARAADGGLARRPLCRARRRGRRARCSSAAALAMTSSSVGPCLRFSRSISAEPVLDLLQPAGRGVEPLAGSRAASGPGLRAAP